MQQIAILVGCAVLPHLKALVTIIQHGLVDENQKVRTICALALSGLAEAAAPFGIESFDSVLKPLWKGVRSHRGKVLAAFLKAIGFIIPLMDAMYSNYYTREDMVILIRVFATPDEEMNKIVLKVVKQYVQTDGVDVLQSICPNLSAHHFGSMKYHHIAELLHSPACFLLEALIHSWTPHSSMPSLHSSCYFSFLQPMSLSLLCSLSVFCSSSCFYSDHPHLR